MKYINVLCKLQAVYEVLLRAKSSKTEACQFWFPRLQPCALSCSYQNECFGDIH